jgi:hypothetical protein
MRSLPCTFRFRSTPKQSCNCSNSLRLRQQQQSQPKFSAHCPTGSHSYQSTPQSMSYDVRHPLRFVMFIGEELQHQARPFAQTLATPSRRKTSKVVRKSTRRRCTYFVGVFKNKTSKTPTHVKIGLATSGSVERRVNQLRTGSVHDLRILFHSGGRSVGTQVSPQMVLKHSRRRSKKAA